MQVKSLEMKIKSSIVDRSHWRLGIEDAIAQHTIRDENTSFGMYLPRMMVGKAVGLERVLTLSYSKNPLKNVS